MQSPDDSDAASETLARYPAGTVRALLDGPHVSAATREALAARLAMAEARAPRFFDAAAFATLRAACARIVPESVASDGAERVPVATMIDERLAAGAGKGWRLNVLPPDREAYALALAAIDEQARTAYGAAFVSLSGARQDELLLDVQRGTVGGAWWERVPPAGFFAELLAEATECYYSHPIAQDDIGFAGMADLPAWIALGLDQLEPREPRPLARRDA